MANRHFGKLADVWKHLVLAEVLAVDRPQRLLDTHAGHAVYPMTADAERTYGVLGFLEVAAGDSSLGRSAYRRLLATQQQPDESLERYPAGPMLAMLERGESCTYLFCDLDPESTANIRDTAARLGLASRAQVVERDGATAVHEAFADGQGGRGTLVYMDPFDHRAVGPAGLSPLDIAVEAASRGTAVVYWYGYNRADQRGWIFNVLRTEAPAVSWWCGDVMVTSPGADLHDGDLGAATSPGTGFGLVCAHASPTAIARCTDLGVNLAEAYHGRTLPDGRVGALDFEAWAAAA